MNQNPTFIKYKKYHRTRYNKSIRTSLVKNGLAGLQVLRNANILYSHLEMSRRFIRRSVNRKTKIWPHLSIWAPKYRKPLNARMGKGKGKLKFWYHPSAKGSIILEASFRNLRRLDSTLSKLSKRIPGKAKQVHLVF